MNTPIEIVCVKSPSIVLDEIRNIVFFCVREIKNSAIGASSCRDDHGLVKFGWISNVEDAVRWFALVDL